MSVREGEREGETERESLDIFEFYGFEIYDIQTLQVNKRERERDYHFIASWFLKSKEREREGEMNDCSREGDNQRLRKQV